MSKVAFSRMDAIFYSPILFFEIADCEALNRQILEETAAMRAAMGQATGRSETVVVKSACQVCSVRKPVLCKSNIALGKRRAAS